ncbi:MAG: transcription-repair coupling factor [Porticoccaceae bacterium]
MSVAIPPEPLPTPFPPPGQRYRWGSLHGAAQALALANAAQYHEGPTLIIAASAKDAARLESELQFFRADAELPVLHFPDREILPYDLFSPHQDIVSARLFTLYQLPNLHQGILVVPITTLLHRLPPPAFIAAHSFVYRVGQRMNIDSLRRQLDQAGYRCVETVYEHGEFAVRGALIDIYPMGAALPLRIDLFGDEIDTLRSFDPETQRSLEKQQALELLPAREFPLDKAAIKHFLDAWHLRFDQDPKHCTLYQDIRVGAAPAGIEYYLPLFFSACSTLFDYLPATTLVFTEGDIQVAVEDFWREAKHRYDEYGVDRNRPLLSPAELFLSADELFGALKRFPRVDLCEQSLPPAAGHHNFPAIKLADVSVDARATDPLAKLHALIKAGDHRILFCAESYGRREALLDLLKRHGVRPTEINNWREFYTGTEPLGITVYPLEQGLALTDPPLAAISESELFGRQILQRRRRSREQENAEQVVKNLTELRPGAPVVHIDHGVGRYRGLQTINLDNEPQEFLTLEYADNTKLYVPVANLHLISRYSGGDEELAPLHRLGNEQWQKAKDKAARQIRDTAAELLDIHARRAARKGFAYQDPEEDYRAFSADFPFEETPDQLDAIEAVRGDMLREQPMDRLICGDVGFGKTEVAMRAAFIAVTNSKQVVVLVPTTLLAQQHHDNFRDRFANWPVRVEMISRFRSGKEQQEIFAQVAAGTVDILIGTHKLLGSEIRYHNLGLLIIDEEHRFGVAQKEKLKALRAEVDILTLTATPIPRTLNLAMGGIRDLSIIATPPARRLSVKTFIRAHEMRLIREAILREILRGGQVYYLHNEVKSIARAARELADSIPEARIEIAHGQMRERELERVMADFYHQRFNVLVCSTIIESGIDVPSANTIIIERADKLGLAQLHQLRGRVGRSHHQAYAYLLTPDGNEMSADAQKRLEAITLSDHLGSGFTLATHDLEIRGAGELLGDEQSGHIHSIGFALYMELLERAVAALRAGKTPDTTITALHGAEVTLNIPALIPAAYLPDIHTRLILYKRLASASNDDQLRELQVEMIDRFGLLPPHLKNLFEVTRLRLQAEHLGIVRLEAGPTGGVVEFGETTLVEPITIVDLVQRQAQVYRLKGARELRFSALMTTAEDRLGTVATLLDQLTPGRDR